MDGVFDSYKNSQKTPAQEAKENEDLVLGFLYAPATMQASKRIWK